jgi:hypothetical protein
LATWWVAKREPEGEERKSPPVSEVSGSHPGRSLSGKRDRQGSNNK